MLSRKPLSLKSTYSTLPHFRPSRRNHPPLIYVLFLISATKTYFLAPQTRSSVHHERCTPIVSVSQGRAEYARRDPGLVWYLFRGNFVIMRRKYWRVVQLVD
jgi:hypothetical protein